VLLTFFDNRSVVGKAGENGFAGEYRTDGGMLTVTGVRSPGSGGCEPAIRKWLSARMPFAVAGMRLTIGDERFRTDDVAVSTLAASLLGLSEDFARRIVETNDLVFRVVVRDGVSATVTQEFRGDRIDVEIERDLVTRASVG
jgi:hypothetical protein